MNKSNKIMQLISPIILLIIGAVLLSKSEEVFYYLSKIVGIILLLNGIISLLSYIRNIKRGINYPSKIFYFIISIALAILFLFFSNIIESIINLTVGGFILFMGINRLIKGITFRRINLIVLSILTIILGVYTIVEGTSIFLSVTGIILIIFSVIEIINYVIYTKDNLFETKESNNDTQLLLTKKEKKKLLKNKKIKDVDPE